MVKPLMFLPLVISLGLGGVAYLALGRENADQLPSALVGKAAPEVAVTPLGEGAPFTAETLRDGKLKLVNFWASWCAPCRVEHPNLQALAAEGIDIYGINYKDTPAQALKFLGDLGSPFKALGADPQGRVAIDWGVYGVPETFLVDGEGKILFRFAGPLTERVIASDLRPLMAAQP
ncbi:DsbE family thiol:disulfide interchange protein [Phaeovulum sp. W22_SRMD_FR3]|uniref:DsbE family thiol:disulfide interchange protein n=1 Tax=Phaeovulum sp. W22_SRMD_FR3 TaxID=3240274 RepID=UPI003F96B6E8